MRIKWSIIIPAVMLAYLAFVAWWARARFVNGEYAIYFGVIGVSLLIIVATHLLLRKKERMFKQKQEAQYGTYADEEKKKAKEKGQTEAADR